MLQLDMLSVHEYLCECISYISHIPLHSYSNMPCFICVYMWNQII